MKQTACFVFVFFLSGHLLAQDSLVFYRDLSFSSNLEQETFSSYKNRKVDFFKLFIAGGKLLTEAQVEGYETQFYAFIANLGYEKGEGKKADKRIKALYDQIEKKYLLKFDTEGSFEEVFLTGKYNSHTGAALLALAFDKLKIPYTIKEEPSQVYLIVNPAAEKIILRTTPEGSQYSIMTPAFKQAFVKMLKTQKVIDAKAVALKSMDEIFDEYYFGKNNDLTLPQLAGITYLNDGLSQYQAADFESAYHQFEKANFLYTSPRTGYLLLLAGVDLATKSTKKDSAHAVLVNKMARYKMFGIERENIVAEFAMATQVILIGSSDIKKYDQYYRVLLRDLDDIQLTNDISFHYNFERGRYAYNKGLHKSAVPFLEKAMELKPTDQDAQSLFVSSLGQLYHSKSGAEVMKSLNEYATRFEELKTNNNFNTYLAVSYLMEFHRFYETNKPTEGDKYKVLFEALMNKDTEMPVNQNAIARAYSTAAVYYFRKGHKVKAKQYIADGLKYAPENYELQSREQMIR